MVALTIVVSILFSIFSTVVMSYLTMAIPIGPWIASTLVLLALLLFKMFFGQNSSKYGKEIALATAAGSVGGILANAHGFYFPTLYFLNSSLFNSWMQSPLYFCSIMTGLSFVGGSFGMIIANLLEDRFLIKEKLAFPIGVLAHKTIATQNKVRKSLELIGGFFSTIFFCLFQDGLRSFSGFIPKTIMLVRPMMLAVFKIPMVRLDLWPMLWALGFVAGHVIALPLFVGVLAKILIASPLHILVFKQLSSMEFLLTFSSGIVLFGAITGFISTPKVLLKSLKKLLTNGLFSKSSLSKKSIPLSLCIEVVVVLLSICSFLTYFEFSLLAQLYIIVFTFFCTYQISYIAGKIGLAFMGRFATFVMVPALFLFSLNNVQLVLFVTFVGLSGGVATDILFGRKLGQLMNISSGRMKKYQFLGLLVSSLCVGIVFWFLINHFGLGSQDLFVYRAQNRWMLINTLRDLKGFNCYVLFLGSIFGYVLKKIKVSPMLALGGLFMPVNITLGLVVGGFVAMLTKDKEEYFPFWSGVYAANSIWMLLKAIV